MIDTISLSRRKLNHEKMLELGFSYQKEEYFYSTKIIDGEFLLIIEIDQNNVVTSTVVEVETNEPYTLYNVKDSVGGFVAKMRNAYNGIIEQIQQNCSIKDVYKSLQAKAIIDYVGKKYGDKLEFLWDDDNAIARNKSSGKWYLVLMTITKSKLGLSSYDKVEIINLHLDSTKIERLVDNAKYFGGFHMNKKYWLTIKLDDTVATEEVFELIDESYRLAGKKK